MLFEPVSITAKPIRLFSSFTRGQTRLIYYYLGPLNYFLGISATRTTSGIFLSQTKYATEILERAQMLNCNPCRTPVDTEKKLGPEGSSVTHSTLYRSLAGALQYYTFTQPDLSCSSSSFGAGDLQTLKLDLKSVNNGYGRPLSRNCKAKNSLNGSRRSKLGKRFGFVRFIKILDVVCLVNNLCTIWIGKFKLHENIARFNRPLLNKGSHSFNPSVNVKPASDASYKKVESRPSISYIQAAKVGISSLSDVKAWKPALVLDDSCSHEPDLALSLASSFNDDSDFDAESVDSQEASILKDEFSDENSDMEEIPETIFDKSEHVGNISPACNEVRMKTRVEEKSEDPPQVNSNLDHINETKVLDKEPGAKASFQEDVNVLGCSGHFQSVKAPKSRGSILHIIEDFIKVGQTMGYKMEGCIKDFKEIVSSQGVREFSK
nr:ribonuclease H-like domain-containing protein [Tanacetum cinerariifolium]